MIRKFDLPKYYTLTIDLSNGNIVITSNSKHAKGRELSQYFNTDGYLRVKMNNKNVHIHHLVAEIFHGERPDKMVINHKDGVKTNNHPENLEYVSIAENIHHAIKHGLHACCNPELMHQYKDGRCKDIKKYKNSWYMLNRERILQKSKERNKLKKENL
jgi:hypothetical protein